MKLDKTKLSIVLMKDSSDVRYRFSCVSVDMLEGESA